MWIIAIKFYMRLLEGVNLALELQLRKEKITDNNEDISVIHYEYISGLKSLFSILFSLRFLIP